jgi:two-component system cell cycle sensor histidine kinase PleC
MAVKTKSGTSPKTAIPSAPDDSALADFAVELRRFLEMSGDIALITSSDGKIEKSIGANLNGNFHDLFGPGDRARAQEAVKTGTPFAAWLGGKWIEWRVHAREGKLFCLGRDITSIRAQEETLLRRQRQLAEAEAIGRMGHWHWTVGSDAIEWSDEIYRIFGVERGKFTPTLHQLDQLVYRRDIGRVIQGFQRAIIERNDYDMEFRIKRPDGEIRFINCEGRCEKDSEGEVVALFGIMQDMTQRMLYERELHEAKDHAERAYAARTQFLANMSHELRTPLNAIIGFSEMMQRQLLGPIGTEKYLDYVDGIRQSGEHLLDLISDILDMSKIEAGKYDLNLEELNISKIVQLALHMMQGRAEEAKINIGADQITNDNLKIVADRRALMQILLNLLSNAVKFTKPGGKIEVQCFEREDYVSLKVSDNGIGIPANKLANIAKPFEQVSSSYARDHQGSGLGLAITKELAEMHGGGLFIESTLGKGTTVTVRLPYKAKYKEKKT